MENEKTSELDKEIVRSVPGLEKHLNRKTTSGTGTKEVLTAIAHDEESDLVAYALHLPIQTLCYPGGIVTLGVYRNGTYAEKGYNCTPVTEIRVREHKSHPAGLVQKMEDGSYRQASYKQIFLNAKTSEMDYPKEIEFCKSDFKKSE